MIKVADIMTQDVVKIRSSATILQAVKLMREKVIRTLIVDRRYPEDAYGIITETDIINEVIAYGKDPQKIRVYEIMTKPCIVVNPNLDINYVARLFKNTGIRCAPVIKDELIGIISVTDILSKSDFLDNPREKILIQEIEQKTREARHICQEFSHDSQRCQEAWLLVEELQAEAAFKEGKKPNKTALQEYLEEYPEATEALSLDNWCSG
ncbi:CBS domain-containing protein [Crocosphaera sp. UHCC 0190]|uniref:CBS domain-containing protein n=1 Tax=Crocosphaera sp. UHCC 0190 TaxID=3110246 RepID=UPI002B1F5A5C|nr:CBS domain-containing protein [Crocosphaera sp. UHCC 0190]MEA5509759.1 CBS domain-containing protein [Crocosphaera sp. UHCC 0190]